MSGDYFVQNFVLGKEAMPYLFKVIRFDRVSG